MGAWTLLEELVKAGVVFLAGFFLKGSCRGIATTWRWMVEIRRCKIDGCGAAAGSATRGLCLKCYGKAKAKVEAGHTTWARLAEVGLCEAENNDPFGDAYSKAMGRDE